MAEPNGFGAGADIAGENSLAQQLTSLRKCKQTHQRDLLVELCLRRAIEPTMRTRGFERKYIFENIAAARTLENENEWMRKKKIAIENKNTHTHKQRKKIDLVRAQKTLFLMRLFVFVYVLLLLYEDCLLLPFSLRNTFAKYLSSPVGSH